MFGVLSLKYTDTNIFTGMLSKFSASRPTLNQH